MHPTTLRNKLYGVIAFPITPFKDDLSLDLPGLHHNLSKLLEHPICALVAAGGTGEMYSLTPAEYARVIELTVHAIEGRVPVVAGVDETSGQIAAGGRVPARRGGQGPVARRPSVDPRRADLGAE